MKRFHAMYVIGVVIVITAGMSATFWASSKVRQVEELSWMNDGFRRAEQITNVFISWLDREKETFKGIASLYYATGDISQEELNAAVNLIEQTEDTIRTLSIAFVTPNRLGAMTVDLAAGNQDLWQVNYPLPDVPAIAETITRAYRSPDNTVIGPIFKAPDNHYQALLGFAPQSGETGGVLLSIIDISTLVDGLTELQIPVGLAVSLLSENQEVLPVNELKNVNSNDANENQAKADKTLRVIGGGKEWYFNWQIFAEYNGGPEASLATAIKLGGSIITLLLSAIIWIQAVQNERITQKVNERTQQLEAAKNQLVQSEKMAALGCLVTGVSHELNTPIGNSLVASSSLRERTLQLKERLEQGSLKKSNLINYFNQALAEAELIESNIAKATELIGSFKQVATDQTSDKKRSFELKTAIMDVIKTFSPTLNKTSVTLVLELEDDIVMDSYPGPLGQIIGNLINNAVVHAFEHKHDGIICLQGHRVAEGKVTLVFKDNGCGISGENLAKIFDPFYTTKLGTGSSGLGLNIVYNLITNVMQGEITVTSRLGEGTVFTIMLPTHIVN